jgi:hypothetical protein
VLLPGGCNIRYALASHDGTKIAFTSDGPRNTNQNMGTAFGIYFVAADGSSYPTMMHLSSSATQRLGSLGILLKWI